MDRHPWVWMSVLCFLLGCQETSKITKSVAPPPPRRKALVTAQEDKNVPNGQLDSTAETSSGEADRSPIQLAGQRAPSSGSSGNAKAEPASAESRSPSDPASVVLARVNGEPIFASDVLQSVAPTLAQSRQTLSPEEYQRVKRDAIRQGLRSLIERQLLLSEAKRTLTEQQLRQLRQAAKADFQKRLRALMQEAGASTEAELNRRLTKEGASVARLRQLREDNYVAQQFLYSRLGPEATLSRREVLEYYEQHQSEFDRPARARWQHLELALVPEHRRTGSQRASRGEAHGLQPVGMEEEDGVAERCACHSCEKARKLKAQLDAGADFDELARRESDGPKAKDGGRWDWTTRGSLAETTLDDAIFSTPVGQTRSILEGADALHLVRVLEREEGGVLPFERAQEEIRMKLRQQKLQQAAQKYLQQLIANAYIETGIPWKADSGQRQ
ncbi:MAG: peptidyl-prolyl cis-trans isomerase [Planctomycetes bacterium]|nr:peptidyl-prolyl cis-trans isomerase [Planctomycetota bacterium]